MKINWHSVSAALTAAAALLLSPAVFNVLPPKVAGVVGGAAIIWQAVTKQVVQSTPASSP